MSTADNDSILSPAPTTSDQDGLSVKPWSDVNEFLAGVKDAEDTWEDVLDSTADSNTKPTTSSKPPSSKKGKRPSSDKYRLDVIGENVDIGNATGQIAPEHILALLQRFRQLEEDAKKELKRDLTEAEVTNIMLQSAGIKNMPGERRRAMPAPQDIADAMKRVIGSDANDSEEAFHAATSIDEQDLTLDDLQLFRRPFIDLAKATPAELKAEESRIEELGKVYGFTEQQLKIAEADREASHGLAIIRAADIERGFQRGRAEGRRIALERRRNQDIKARLNHVKHRAVFRFDRFKRCTRSNVKKAWDAIKRFIAKYGPLLFKVFVAIGLYVASKTGILSKADNIVAGLNGLGEAVESENSIV